MTLPALAPRPACVLLLPAGRAAACSQHDRSHHHLPGEGGRRPAHQWTLWWHHSQLLLPGSTSCFPATVSEHVATV